MPFAEIPVRRPKLDFAREIPHFYIEGNPIKTHFFNALNLAFPDGERFFIRAVHEHADCIDDPGLLEAVRAFSGQEGQHASQHERFFKVLEAQGYDVSEQLRAFRALCRWANRNLPKSLRLAVTAGAEHYTATLAALVLRHDMVEECDPTMRDLIEWHALEEIEHKDVAYEVLIRSYPRNYPLRIAGFVLASGVVAYQARTGMRALLLQDGRARRLTHQGYLEARAALSEGKSAMFRRVMRRQLLAYFRPGFHPAQQDDRPLLERYRPRIAQRVAA